MMAISMTVFEQPIGLLQGLIIGGFIGFLFQKGRLSQFKVIIGQFLLRDFTMLKIMLVAILVIGIKMYTLHWLGWLSITSFIDPMLLSRVAVGGTFLGVGMAILGYCPASSFAAIGQGARDAMFGVLGMIAGAIIFNLLYPWIIGFFSGQPAVYTLATFLGICPCSIFIGLFFAAILLFYLLERAGR